MQSFERVGTKRRPKTQKRKPPQKRLEITLKWFERDYRPTQRQETTGFAGVGTKRRPVEDPRPTNEDPLKIVLKSL